MWLWVTVEHHRKQLDVYYMSQHAWDMSNVGYAPEKVSLDLDILVLLIHM